MAISPQKIFFTICFFLTFSLVISCGTNSTKSISTAIVTTIPTSMTPALKPIAETTITPTTYPKYVSADSPDSKYHIELTLDTAPINLIITNVKSRQSKQILITNRYYNRILGDGSIGFKWSSDNKTLLFELYKEPFPSTMDEDFSCFIAVNMETTKIASTQYSSQFRGLWIDDKDTAFLEHSGLNDTYDYYIIGTNCYKWYDEGECTNSFISPIGNWEFNQNYDTEVLATNISGKTWKYDYLIKDAYSGNITFIQRWSSDEKYVYFSPSSWYASPYVLGLFQMDLSNGKVKPIFNEELDREKQFYYLSLSPSTKIVFYIDKNHKTVIKDLQNESVKTFPSKIIKANQVADNFLWSPDETKLVFMIEDFDKEHNYSSADYLILNVETGEIKTFLKDQKEYLFLTNINNDSITLSNQEKYSLFDGSKIK